MDEEQERLERLLLEGLASPASGMTAKAWRDVRREVGERAEALQGIRRGLAEFEQGQGRPTREALEELRTNNGRDQARAKAAGE